MSLEAEMGKPVRQGGRVCMVSSDTMHNETRYWNEDEIQRTSYDIYFSIVKIWRG
jgi:hypothetical protein